MLKISKKRTKRKKSELNVTSGKNVGNAIIKSAEKSAYAAGNNTDKIIKLAKNAVTMVDQVTEFIGKGKSAIFLGKIAFKTTKDIARGDNVCKGLCVVSGTCKTIALCCSTVKVIPFRGRIYVGAKIVSRGYIFSKCLCG